MLQPSTTFSLTSHSGQPISISRFDNLVPYEQSYEAMSEFANQRSADDADKIWVLQHPKIYTQGTACELDTFLPSNIPTIKTDRGGQITYHGPGQIVVYPLITLKRYGIGAKSLVFKLEQCIIDTLGDLDIEAERHSDAPGVYVNGAKIGALGLRIRKGTSYHGLSLNVDMDLTPFSNIDPCGYQGLKVCNIIDHTQQKLDIDEISNSLVSKFVGSL